MPKLISKSVTGIMILLAIGAIWQVAPVSAGITPTPSPPPATIPPTAIPPTDTPVPPTDTPAPLLPVSGGQASGLNNIEIIVVSLAGGLLLLLAGISLVIRKSARTRT